MKTRKAVDKILEIIMILFMSVLLTDVLWQVISRYLNRFLVKNFPSRSIRHIIHSPTSWQVSFSYGLDFLGLLMLRVRKNTCPLICFPIN